MKVKVSKERALIWIGKYCINICFGGSVAVNIHDGKQLLFSEFMFGSYKQWSDMDIIERIVYEVKWPFVTRYICDTFTLNLWLLEFDICWKRKTIHGGYRNLFGRKIDLGGSVMYPAAYVQLF